MGRKIVQDLGSIKKKQKTRKKKKNLEFPGTSKTEERKHTAYTLTTKGRGLRWWLVVVLGNWGWDPRGRGGRLARAVIKARGPKKSERGFFHEVLNTSQNNKKKKGDEKKRLH